MVYERGTRPLLTAAKVFKKQIDKNLKINFPETKETEMENFFMNVILF